MQAFCIRDYEGERWDGRLRPSECFGIQEGGVCTAKAKNFRLFRKDSVRRLFQATVCTWALKDESACQGRISK